MALNAKQNYHGYELPIGGRLGHFTYELSEAAWKELLSVLTEEQKETLGLNRVERRASWNGPF